MANTSAASVPLSPEVQILRADTDQLRFGCQAVRWKVFVVEQKVPFALEIDARDFLASTIHLAATTGDQVVGTVRVLRDGPQQFHLGRLAVLPEARGNGLGSALVIAVHDAVRRLLSSGSSAAVVAEAQVQATGMYRKLGYRAVSSEIYLDAGIEHQTMTTTVENPETPAAAN